MGMIVDAVFAFARMNPPTTGHSRIVEKLRAEADRRVAVARLYLSQSHDDERNPLDPETKAEFVRKLFPGLDVRLSKTLFTAALEMAGEGIENGVMVVGEDRAPQFAPLLERYAGKKELGLKTAQVLAISRAEEDASATQARAAAMADDFQAFKALSPTADEDLSQQLFKAVKLGLGVT